MLDLNRMEVVIMSNLVKVMGNQVVVDSREVAKNFGKEHRNVMRAIDGLIKGMLNFAHTPEMFSKAESVNEQNGQTYNCYVMNRDGFSLLVMGFTGAKALEWKIKYIQAFNAMEQELMQRTAPKIGTSTTPAGDALEDAVKAKAAILQLVTGIKDGMATLQALEYAEHLHGISMEPVRVLIPAAEHKVGKYNPTQLGECIGLKAQAVNKLLADRGWQVRDGKKWHLTEAGTSYGEELPFKRNGHSDYRILWNEDAMNALQAGEQTK